MKHLHAKKPDDVRVIQPGERSHLLASRVHDDRRRNLDGNACETAPVQTLSIAHPSLRACVPVAQHHNRDGHVVRAVLTFSSLHVLPQTYCTVGARA